MNSVPGSAVATARAVVAPLATAFSEAGYRLYLVGGLVRDDLLGRVRDDVDYDLTTDARPETIKTLVDPFADAVWTAGERFGTIACRIDGVVYEITTHRADAYDESSRKPIVEFGDNVHDDLARRDFTVNAIAIDLADGTLVGRPKSRSLASSAKSRASFASGSQIDTPIGSTGTGANSRSRACIKVRLWTPPPLTTTRRKAPLGSTHSAHAVRTARAQNAVSVARISTSRR